jgi:hypothetical protein
MDILRVLVHDGADRQISGICYKVVAQSVLLYLSETWVLTPIMLWMLDGFHTQIVRRQAVYQPTFQMKDVGNTHLLGMLWKRDYTLFLSTYFDDILP